jgi:uncharacterized BrkB/YihY/UPF0761 family membrane protein
VGVSTTATNVAAIFELGILAEVLGHALAFAVNAAVLLFTYWLLTTGPNAARELLPGAVAGGVGLMILQIAGNWLMERHIKGASDTYGTFAVVIALLSWFFLVSRIVLLSAELNSVLARRLSPRSIVHEAGLTDADRRAAELDAHRVQRDDRLDVEVEPAPPASATT